MILKPSTVPLLYKAYPHPRSEGSYSRMLGEYGHDKRQISLMEVALRSSLLPAKIIEKSVSRSGPMLNLPSSILIPLTGAQHARLLMETEIHPSLWNA
jgi:hypothetical protein